jgi:hypothetical protein
MSDRIETQLAARLALRAALARIAAEHPDMAEADEQGRLDAWLAAEHDAEENTNRRTEGCRAIES